MGPGPYKPLRNRVDDHPLLYGNNGSLDPGTNEKDLVTIIHCFIFLQIWRNEKNGISEAIEQFNQR